MEAAIQTLVKVYLKSSKGKENLGKKDFQCLVKNQLGNILSDSDSKEAINNMAAGLDVNNDGRLGFEEYMKLIGYLATSLSEQRTATQEEQVKNATGQVANSCPDKEEKTEANAEVKVEPKAEGTAEAAVGPAEAAVGAAEAAVGAAEAAVGAAEAAVGAATGFKIEVPKVEVPAEGEVKVEVPKETTEVVTTTTTMVTEGVSGALTEVTKVTEVTEVIEVKEEVEEVKEEVKEETVKAEEAPAAEEKTEEKTEETTS